MLRFRRRRVSAGATRGEEPNPTNALASFASPPPSTLAQIMRHDLAVAHAVCRECGGLDGLDHVVSAISALLDASRPWTLEDAAAKGYSTLVERILWTMPNHHKEIPDKSFTRAMERAAAHGHLATIKVLFKWNPSCKVASAMEEAAVNGYLEIVVWLHEHAAASSDRMTLDAMDSAAVNGHLSVVEWLHLNRPEGCTTRAMDGAARAGRLEIVKWLHVHRCEGCTTQAMDGAAANGHLEVVQWLHFHRHEGCTSLASIVAGLRGHDHVVLWLERMQSDANMPLVAWHEKKALRTARSAAV